MIIIIMARPTWPESCLSNCLLPIPAWFFAPPISDSKIIWEYQDLDHDDNGEKYCDPRHEICQNFTPPDFQAKDFTPLISLNFNSFSDKNTKNECFWRNLHHWQKILHYRRQWRQWQISPLCDPITYLWNCHDNYHYHDDIAETEYRMFKTDYQIHLT